jgi:hypothetical protein
MTKRVVLTIGEEDDMRIAHRDGAGRVQDRIVDGTHLKLDAAGVHLFGQRHLGPVEARLPMSTVTLWSPARTAVVGPPAVSMTTRSDPFACISIQPTQRRALPQVSTMEPSAFQTRMKASALSDGSMAISWSKPSPDARSARERICSSVGRNGCSSALTTTKSLPAPFILTKGRVMQAI